MAKKNEPKKLKLDINISILDKMIGYIFSQNGNVTKKCMMKMKELFSILDDSVFESDRQMEVRVFLIRRLLQSRIDKGIADYEMLAESIFGGQYDDEIMEIYQELDETGDLGDDEVFFLDEYISDRLSFGYIYQYEEELDQKLLQLRSGDFDSLSEFNDEFEVTISGLYGLIKKAKATSKYASRDFGTDGESLDCAITQTINNLNKTTNIIRTGIKWINKMLQGGYQAGRTYLFLGLAKG